MRVQNHPKQGKEPLDTQTRNSLCSHQHSGAPGRVLKRGTASIISLGLKAALLLLTKLKQASRLFPNNSSRINHKNI